jgi:Transglutaminase-like superfamily
MSPARLKKSWPHSLGELWLLVRVLWMLTLIRIKISRVKLPALLEQLTPSATTVSYDQRKFDKIVGYIDGLIWRVPYTRQRRCMPRALTLYYFAMRCGVGARFHCGVKRREQTLDGHAWLTLDGAPFLEEESHPEEYTVTFSYPADAIPDEQ